MGIRCSAPARLCELNFDPVPEVRAAMLHAVTTFIGIPDLTDQVAQIEESLALAVLPMSADGSVIVISLSPRLEAHSLPSSGAFAFQSTVTVVSSF